jgi:hypothetical protein
MNAQEERYKRRETTWVYWDNKSCDLRASAGVIWHAMQTNKKEKKVVKELGLGSGFDLSIACFESYYMLCGLSLELRFKAILVAKRSVMKLTHDLCILAKQAGVEYDQNEMAALNVLSKSVIWSAKYPVPKGGVATLTKHDSLHDEYFFKKIKIGSLELKASNGNSLDWETFNNLWGKAGGAF